MYKPQKQSTYCIYVACIYSILDICMHTPPYIQAFVYIPIDDGQKPSISRLRKGKGTSFSDGIKPGHDCTGIVKMPHCHIVPYLHYSISCFSVTIE